MIHKLKILFSDTIDKLKIWWSKKGEKKKYRDSRRKQIYQSIKLNKVQKEEVNKFYHTHYGKRVSLIWHRHFSAFTGNFDKTYFPECLYIPEFEHYMNFDETRYGILADKNFLPIVAKGLNVKMPATIVSRVRGGFRDKDNVAISFETAKLILQKKKDFFIKPSVDSSSGNGCYLVHLIDGVDNVTSKSIEEIFTSVGNDFVAQEIVSCCSDIQSLYSNGVNTFRVITYRWKDRIEFMPSIMRIGCGGKYLDNAHAGGIFIAIDEDGTLHDTAFTEFNQQFKYHPDTGILFDRYRIKDFPRVLSTAKKMHEALSQVGVVNWDFTIDDNNNVVLIEANIFGGSVWLSQMAHGKGPFGDKTEEVLEWMKIMRKTPAHKRIECSFGRMKG